MSCRNFKDNFPTMKKLEEMLIFSKLEFFIYFRVGLTCDNLFRPIILVCAMRMVMFSSFNFGQHPRHLQQIKWTFGTWALMLLPKPFASWTSFRYWRENDKCPLKLFATHVRVYSSSLNQRLWLTIRMVVFRAPFHRNIPFERVGKS